MLWNAKNGCAAIGDTEMHYVSFGRGARTFIILPGLSDGLVTVSGKALMLAWPYRQFFKDFTVYMFSRKNSMPDGYTIRDMAADQAAACAALGIGRACVMGVSQGGMIAQYLAIDHPELVEKLVIAVSVPRTDDALREGILQRMAMAERGDHKSLMIDAAEKAYTEKKLRLYRMIYPLFGRIGRPKDYRRFLINARAIMTFDAEDKTVGVQGSYDMHGRIPGSVLHVYPGLGHAAYEEAPDFNDRVFRFLTDAPAGDAEKAPAQP